MNDKYNHMDTEELFDLFLETGDEVAREVAKETDPHGWTILENSLREEEEGERLMEEARLQEHDV